MKMKLFVLGDSISIHYGYFLKTFVEDSFDYRRKGDSSGSVVDIAKSSVNGGDSSLFLEYLKSGAESVLDADILLLNCGLHDIKIAAATGRHQVPAALYRKNLRNAFELIRSRASLRAIWVRSTHVDDAIHNAKVKGVQHFNCDIKHYNKIADEEVKAAGLPFIDLNAFTEKLEPGIFEDHIHFIPEVRKLQAAFITGSLFGMLSQENSPSGDLRTGCP